MVSEAWEKGCKAAWEWQGTPEPKNPYSEGTQDATDWDAGFEQGCDDYYELWKAGEV